MKRTTPISNEAGSVAPEVTRKKETTDAPKGPFSRINEAGLIYQALDVHARHCVIGARSEDGRSLGETRVVTGEQQLLAAVRAPRAARKWLTFEEGAMAPWLCALLRPEVEKLLVCDPRENALIGRSARKRDQWDVRALCRLFALGELKEVWHEHEPARLELHHAAEHYCQMRGQLIRAKSKLKAWYKRHGVMAVDTSRVYSVQGRKEWIGKLPAGTARLSAHGHYAVIDALQASLTAAWERIRELGRHCPEIARFTAVPGVGRVGAHLFSALIVDPRRFATDQKLWRYCKLAIVDRTSDGKPLGYQRLERHGNGELKAVSYHAWKGSLVGGKPNAVRGFFEASLARTGDRRHARLNTQRKVLSTLASMWRHQSAFCAETFLRAPVSPGADATHPQNPANVSMST
jgi:transposase